MSYLGQQTASELNDSGPLRSATSPAAGKVKAVATFDSADCMMGTMVFPPQSFKAVEQQLAKQLVRCGGGC